MKAKKLLSFLIAACLVATSYSVPVQAEELDSQSCAQESSNTDLDETAQKENAENNVENEGQKSNDADSEDVNEEEEDKDNSENTSQEDLDNNTDEASESETIDADENESNTDSDETIEDSTFVTPDGKHMTGCIVDENQPEAPAYIPDNELEINGTAELPAKYPEGGAEDIWEKFPVCRMQYSGTCAIYSSIACCEFSMVSQGKADKTVDYSEALMAYYTPMGEGYYGATLISTIGTLAQNIGVVTEEQVPISTLGRKKEEATIDEKYKQSEDVAVLDHYSYINLSENVDEAKQAIMENGGLLMEYSSPCDIMTDENGNEINYGCLMYYDTYEGIDHASVIVGWDDNLSKDDFAITPETDGAWLVRNSWGQYNAYSINSYFWLSYCDKSLDHSVYSIVMREADDFDRECTVAGCDSYNSLNIGNTWYGVEKIATSASKNQQINSLFIKSDSSSNSVNILIYEADSGVTADTFELDRATLVGETSATFTFAGGQRVDFSEPVKTSKDKTYFVVYKNIFTAVWFAYLTDQTESAATEADKYYITYKSNNDIPEDESNMISFNTEGISIDTDYTLQANRFTKKYYEFAGWNTSADGSGVSYGDGATVKNLAEAGKRIFLYAQWTPVAYGIVFDANGGQGAMEDLIISPGTSFTLPKNTYTKEGYTFLGWTVASNGNGELIKDGATLQDFFDVGYALTLYAKWKAPFYKIIFEGNEGSGTMEALEIKHGVSFTLPANTYTRKNYEFLGWNTAQDGSGTSYADGATLINIAEEGDEIHFYAQWRAYFYKIIFDSTGGQGTTMEDLIVYPGNSFTLSINTYTKKCYKFKEWNTKYDGSGTSYADGASLKNIAEAGDVIHLYAQWTPLDYTIVFDANGGQGTMDSVTATAGGSVTLPICTFTREDYMFCGWVLDANSTKEAADYYDGCYIDADYFGADRTENGKLTLFAYWVKTSDILVVEDGVLTAYNGPSNWEEITIPDSVTEIGTGVFKNNYNILSITLPKTIVAIDDEAFCIDDSEQVRNLTINLDKLSNLKTIGKSAFKNRNVIEKNFDPYKKIYFELPDSIEIIGDSAFDNSFGSYYHYIYYCGRDNLKTVGETPFGSEPDNDNDHKFTICSYSGDAMSVVAEANDYDYASFITVRYYGDETKKGAYTDRVATTDFISIDSDIKDSDGNEVVCWLTDKYNYKTQEGVFYQLNYYAEDTVHDLNPKMDFSKYLNDENIIELYPYYDSDNWANLNFNLTSEETEDIQSAIDVERNKAYGKVLQEITKKLARIAAKQGLVFAGWYLNEDFTGDAVTADTICKKRVRHTLYAKWTKQQAAVPVSNFADGAVLYVGDRITLTSSTGAEIYYTLDGSIPVYPVQSVYTTKKYSGAIKVNSSLVKRSAGTITISAIGVGTDFENSEVATYTYSFDSQGDILDEDMSDTIPTGLWVAGIDESGYDYTGKQIKLSGIRVYYGASLLTENKDYTLSYKNNINAGTASFTITGKGFYKGVKSDTAFTFKINPINLASKGQVANVIVTNKYNKKIQAPKNVITATVNGKTTTLKSGRDYKLTYDTANPPKEAGNYIITATGEGNYTGSLYFIENIVSFSQVNLSKTKCSWTGSFIYDGSTHSPVNSTSGTATFVTKDASATPLVGIEKSAYDALLAELSSSSDEKEESKDRTEIMTSIMTTLSAYDYTYEYVGDRTNIGKVTVKFKGIGKYTGSLTKTFSINPESGHKLSGYKIYLSAKSLEYNGFDRTEDLKALATVKNKAGDVLTLDTDYSLTFSRTDLTNVGKITITATGIKAYTGKLKATVNIDPYIRKYTVPDENMTDFVISGFESAVYEKKGCLPSGTVTYKRKVTNEGEDTYENVLLTLGKDYKITASNNKKVAAADAMNSKGKSIAPAFKITGLGNFKGTVITGNFAITAADISECTATAASISSNKSTCALKTTVKVVDKNGSALKEGTDYKLTYSCDSSVTTTDKKNVAKDSSSLIATDKIVFKSLTEGEKDEVTVKVTGIGNYEGSETSTSYYVMTDSRNLAKAAITVTGKNYRKLGFNIYDSDLTVKLSGLTLSNDDETSFEISNIKFATNGKSGTVTITGTGKYGGRKTVKFNLSKLDISK